MKKLLEWINTYFPDLWGLTVILIISLLLCAGLLWSLDLVVAMMGRLI